MKFPDGTPLVSELIYVAVRLSFPINSKVGVLQHVRSELLLNAVLGATRRLFCRRRRELGFESAYRLAPSAAAQGGKNGG